ncbi:hypothetical protein ACF5W4_09195 [Bacillota bacterium Lsc_1132]
MTHSDVTGQLFLAIGKKFVFVSLSQVYLDNETVFALPSIGS